MTTTTHTGAVPGRGLFSTDLLPLPIVSVTCLEDRAQVERCATVQLAAGVQRLRLGPVTPLAVDRSLRADIRAAEHPQAPQAGATARTSAHQTGDAHPGDTHPGGDMPGDTGARVVDAQVVRSWTPVRPDRPGPEASVLRREVAELEREVREAEAVRRRLDSRLAVIAQAKAELHRDITETAGAGDADPERWADRLARVDTEAEEHLEQRHRLVRRLRDVSAELGEAKAALRRAEAQPEELSAVVEVVVEAVRPGPAVLRIVHLTPCALWRPAYRATLAGDDGSLTLEADAVVWQRTGEDWQGVRLVLSTARPTLASSPPRLTDDELTLRDRSAEERRSTEVDLREEEVRTVGGDSSAAGADAELPGVDDGGEVRVLQTPVPVSVASDGRPHRVGVSEFTTPCRSEHGCAPELSTVVGQVAHAVNSSGHVLLAGPVDLVRGSGFVGRGRLEFTGVGEEFRLPFGSEDDHRVVRHVEERRESTGLTGINQRTVLTRTVRLFVSRLDAASGGEARPVVVRERIPVSEVSAVEVRLRKDGCVPPPDEVDADGIVRYELLLAPGERREVRLVYEIVAGGSVQGI